MTARFLLANLAGLGARFLAVRMRGWVFLFTVVIILFELVFVDHVVRAADGVIAGSVSHVDEIHFAGGVGGDVCST